MRILKFLFPIVLAAGLLAGCGGGGSAQSLRSDDVAVVGNVHVTKAQYDALIAQAEQSFKSQGRAFPKQGTTDYETIKGQAVLLLVQQAEREAKADSMGIHVSDKDVNARLAQIKKQYFSGSEAKYEAYLKKQKLPASEVRDDILQQLIAEDIFDKVTKNVTVSDSAVDAYYKAHPSLYSQPESRDVRYILVGKSKATAESVYNQLKNGSSQTWCTLAKKYAKDASGQNCGKATFTKGQTVPAFDKVAFSAPANVVHTPFFDPTEYKSWFVVEPLGPVKSKTTTPEKQVASSIRQQLLQQKKNTVMTDWTTSLTKQFCSGSKVRYAVGYSASPDPCAATTTNSTTG
jgi:parvulin-like peptidyl-prolyl isomerase